MLKDLNFNLTADASSPESTAKELMAIKMALGLILAKLPSDSQNEIVQNLIDIPAPEAKDLGTILNQFKHIHQAG